MCIYHMGQLCDIICCSPTICISLYKELYTSVHKSFIAPKLEQFKYQSIGECISYHGILFSNLGTSVPLIPVTAQMELKIIMLHDRSQMEEEYILYESTNIKFQEMPTIYSNRKQTHGFLVPGAEVYMGVLGGRDYQTWGCS